MSIRTFEEFTPVLAEGVFIDATALVIGDVELGKDSSVWPMSVIRGDVQSIRIGQRDRLTPPADLERVVERLGSEDKTFWVAGHASGLAHEYSHVDLVLGRHAPDEIYPRVAEWLETRDAIARV